MVKRALHAIYIQSLTRVFAVSDLCAMDDAIGVRVALLHAR